MFQTIRMAAGHVSDNTIYHSSTALSKYLLWPCIVAPVRFIDENTAFPVTLGYWKITRRIMQPEKKKKNILLGLESMYIYQLYKIIRYLKVIFYHLLSSRSPGWTTVVVGSGRPAKDRTRTDRVLRYLLHEWENTSLWLPENRPINLHWAFIVFPPSKNERVIASMRVLLNLKFFHITIISNLV